MDTLGFDFGTTNSLVSIIQGNRAICLTDGDGLAIPSMICYEGANTIVGQEARKRLGKAGLEIHGNVVRSPKALLSREKVYISGVERSPIEIASDVIKYIKAEAEKNETRFPGLKVSKVIATIPVHMEGYTRARLRDAFLSAGINIVQFVHEPLAALYAYIRSQEEPENIFRKLEQKVALVFDWGGGTLDLTLCKIINGHIIQLGNDGTDEVGGDVFDDTMMSYIIQDYIGQHNMSPDVELQIGAKERLLHNCERIKIDLSVRNDAILFVTSFFKDINNPDLEYVLTREKLNKIVEHLLKNGISRIPSLLEREGHSLSSVSLCLASGGMTNMPAVRERLYELFGPQRVHIPERSGSLISEGAAWVAYDSARLHLAKRLELTLARNSYMTLLDAGLAMPLEGLKQNKTFSLYCADPTDGFGKFEFLSPHRPGQTLRPNDPRRILGTLTVPVDSKAKPFFERLHLDVCIDDNLILTAKAHGLDKNTFKEISIHDLEFSLKLPFKLHTESKNTDTDTDTQNSSNSLQAGAVLMRSNITFSNDKILVPGEILYKFDRQYFDARLNPPQIQIDEHLYYQPCSICKRAYNDILCKCDKNINHS